MVTNGRYASDHRRIGIADDHAIYFPGLAKIQKHVASTGNHPSMGGVEYLAVQMID